MQETRSAGMAPSFERRSRSTVDTPDVEEVVGSSGLEEVVVIQMEDRIVIRACRRRGLRC